MAKILQKTKRNLLTHMIKYCRHVINEENMHSYILKYFVFIYVYSLPSVFYYYRICLEVFTYYAYGCSTCIKYVHTIYYTYVCIHEYIPIQCVGWSNFYVVYHHWEYNYV